VINPIYINPLQFAASITADFIQAAMPQHPCSLLDVGCGDGLIAAELLKMGADVFAIDGNDGSVSRARAIGVNATHCLLLDFEHSPFDLVFVSRALHHMPPLADTVKKLESMIRSDGVLVIEDFGFELVDCTAAAWLINQTKQIKEKSTMDEGRHKWLVNATDLSPEEACEIWLEHHWTKHQLLASEEMKKELTSRFNVESYQASAYLFRYLCDFLPSTAGGGEHAHQIWQEETSLIAKGALPAVGFRMILRKK
jgi:SAM-dependent methyltransferase